ncbi:hypothetical protein U0070_015697 [Myodes glareolus]|uniref:Uncharacterized protein n=1 Tax=Myodes glareolus TaxID=447135 RepID=A0AAW0HHA9_MYOGA
MGRWRHLIHIHFLPGKNFAIAYFRGKMNYQYYQIMMLMVMALRASVLEGPEQYGEGIPEPGKSGCAENPTSVPCSPGLGVGQA